MTIKSKIKFLFNRENRNLYTVKEFAHANRDLLIIVCDPKTDQMFATYRDHFVNGKIKDTTGKKANVVRKVLKYSLFEKTIDGFMSSLMETLHLPIWRANLFYQFIDGAIFNIAKNIRMKRKVESKSIPSPYVEKSNIKN